MSMGDAAKAVGCHASQISRMRSAGKFEGVRAGKKVLVSLAEVQRALEEDTNPLMRREPEARAASPKQETLSDAQRRKALAQATSAEIETAKRLGEVCDQAGVVKTATSLAPALHHLMRQRRRPLAERLARMDDPIAIELEIERDTIEMLAEWQAQILRDHPAPEARDARAG